MDQLVRNRSSFATALVSILAVLHVCCFLAFAAEDPPQSTPSPFRFGFSTSLLREFNENDAKASMRTWVHAVVNERNLPADPEATMFTGIPALRTAIENRAVDGIVLHLDEFWALNQPQAFAHFVFPCKEGSISEEYVLLVHKDSGISQISDLRGRSLAVFQHSKMCLATYWLDALLMQKGLKPSSKHFARVNEVANLTKTVLPVFFRQADACVVTRSGFKTMVELNPQIGQQLQVLAASDPLIPTIICFRAGYSPEIQRKIIAEFTTLHKSPSGQQVLTVCQFDRLEEHPFSYLTNSLALLETYSRLASGTNVTEISKLIPARERF